MKISTFFYCCGQGIKNIKRNKLFSLASIGTITACIFLIGLFYIVIANFQYLVKEAEQSVGISVFFTEDCTAERKVEIGKWIEARPEVEEIKYISPEEAWNGYKEVYFAEDPSMADGFKDDNPLANSDSFQIKLNDVSAQDNLVKALKIQDGVRKLNYSESAARTLTDFGRIVGYISVAIIIILLAVGIFLISNTVMIGITVRREEIKIMKLIGARDMFVKLPFYIEGVIIGFVGAIPPIVALIVLYKKVAAYIVNQFSTLEGNISFLGMHQIFSIVIPMGVIIGAGIGLVGSMLTIRRHLRV